MSETRVEAISRLSLAITKEVSGLIDRGSKTCLNCVHFDEAAEVCKADVMKRRPPARIIAHGCKSHEDEIPF